MEYPEIESWESLERRGQAVQIAELAPVMLDADHQATRRRLVSSLKGMRDETVIDDAEWRLLVELARPGTTYAEVGDAFGMHGHAVVRKHGELVDRIRGYLAAGDPDFEFDHPRP